MDKKIWGVIGGIALVLALLSPFVLGSKKKVEQIFEDAEELYEQEQYEEAIAKYNKVLKESKKIGVKIKTIDVDFIACVNYKMARCLKLINRVDEALQHYRFIVSQFPNSQYATDSYVDSGDIYFDRKDYKAASEAYKQALDTIVDVERRKQIHQKYQQTLVLINPPEPTGIPEPPPSEDIDTRNFAVLIEATSLRFEKRFKEAATQYEVFANTYLPTEEAVYALYWAGRCYYETDLFSQSIDAFERLIDDYSYSPNAIEAYHGLAKSYCSWAEKEGDKSDKWLLVISTIDAAEEKYSTRDTTLNRKFLRLIVDIKRKIPDKFNITPNEYYDRGLEFLDANRYSEAIVMFNKVISIDAQYKEAHFHLSVAYFNLHNYAYAENALNEALAIDPEYEEALRLSREITESRD